VVPISDLFNWTILQYFRLLGVTCGPCGLLFKCDEEENIAPQDANECNLQRCEVAVESSLLAISYVFPHGALLQICSLPTRCPPRRGALDMCSTARIFRLEHNLCMKNTSTILNPGRSAASAQHSLRPPLHSFIASG